MTDGPFILQLFFDELPDRLVETVLDTCKMSGVYQANHTGSNGPSTPEDVPEAIRGGISLPNLPEASLRFNFEVTETYPWVDGLIHISTGARLLADDDSDNPDLRGYRESLVELLRALTIATDPSHVHSYGTQTATNEFIRGVVPEHEPIPENLSNVPWLSIYHPETVVALGGVERFLDAPAHQVKELETGHVMVVATEDPFAVPDRELEKYLLGNKGE